MESSCGCNVKPFVFASPLFSNAYGGLVDDIGTAPDGSPYHRMEGLNQDPQNLEDPNPPNFRPLEFERGLILFPSYKLFTSDLLGYFIQSTRR